MKYPPVLGEHESRRRNDALAALEVEIKRERMTQNAEYTREVLADVDHLRSNGAVARDHCKEQTAEQYRDYAFERVTDDSNDRGNLADRTQNVRKACVAAAHLADILLALRPYFSDDDGRIDTANQIRDNGGEQPDPPVCAEC